MWVVKLWVFPRMGVPMNSYLCESTRLTKPGSEQVEVIK